MFEGSLVALVTPMDSAGELDLDALRSLLRWHLEQGTDGIVLGGTTGESPTLAAEELETMLAVARETLGDRLPLIAGTGTNDTRRTLDLTRRACAAGASACLVVTPYYNKPTQEGLYQHFQAVAETATRPIILYNVPARTGCDLVPETVARLAVNERIVAIKEATASVDRVRALREQCGETFTVLSGDDATAVDTMRQGARGVISVTANVAPRAVHAVCQAALCGDFDAAGRQAGYLRPLHAAMFAEPNPIPVKWALAHLGLIQNVLRLPLTPLGPAHHAQVADALKAATQ